MPGRGAQSIARRAGRQAGFTLIELMIAVVVMAVLATVAAYAYKGHLRETRVLDAKQVLNRIKVQQEVYFQKHRSYVSAQYHPPLHTDYAAKPWTPLPADWANLGLSFPGDGTTYFSFRTVGFAVSGGDAISMQLGLNSAIPSFYVMATGDMDGSPATQPMSIVIDSQSAKVLITNEGQ